MTCQATQCRTVKAATVGGKAAAPAGHAAALEIELDLPQGADRTAFIRAVMEAIEAATAPYRHRRGDDLEGRPKGPAEGRGATYRMRLAIYPVPNPELAPSASTGDQPR